MAGAKFDLGHVYLTPGIVEKCGDEQDVIHGLLKRHAMGDWGELDDHDVGVNEQALREGGRLMSSYHAALNGRVDEVWVITEGAPSEVVTTVLLPSEY